MPAMPRQPTVEEAPTRQPATNGGSVLDPVERLSEILFGIIMALTFTGSIHAADSGREEIRTMLLGALGCNLAWGIVDAVMYLTTELVTRNRALRALRDLRREPRAERAHAILADALPHGVVQAMSPTDFEALRRWLAQVPELPASARVTPRLLRGAAGVFLLVTLSTFPLVVPFLILRNPVVALRSSHAIALAMLFVIGATLGRHAGTSAVKTGITMLGLGVVLAALAIALGG